MEKKTFDTNKFPIVVHCKNQDEISKVINYTKTILNNEICDYSWVNKEFYIRISPGSPFGKLYGEFGTSTSDYLYTTGIMNGVCKIITFETFKKEYLMENKRTIEISLKTAREWYYSNNESLKQVALQAFDKEELSSITYKDIYHSLFKDKSLPNFAVNMYSVKQCDKLKALIKLMNVAKYLNGDWKPNFEDTYEEKYILILSCFDIKTEISYKFNYGIPYFKTKELAEQAVEILGEETIKLALSQV